MARSKSIILSKVEKKAVVAELKGKIKTAQTEAKAISGAVKTAKKLYENIEKNSAKTLATLNKNLAAHQAQLAAVTAPDSTVSA